MALSADDLKEILANAESKKNKIDYKHTLIGQDGSAIDSLINGGSGTGLILEGLEEAGYTLKHVNSSIMDFVKNTEGLLGTFIKTNDAASKFAKSVGMGGAAFDAYAKRIQNLSAEKEFGTKYGATAEDLIKLQQSYTESLGRNIGVSDLGLEQMAGMKAMGIDEGVISQFENSLENIGVSIETSGKYTARMWNDAKKAGLSFKQYSKEVSDNLTLVSKLGFKNGVRDLEKMVKRSMELGLNIKTASSVAEKLMDGGVAASTEMGAKLQVLGGSFSKMANPLSMMNEGLNSAGALQERIGRMLSDVGKYNAKTHEFEIGTAEKLQMRAAAQAMGVTYDELYTSANRQALSGEIERKLDRRQFAGLSEERRNYVKNTGVIDENGNVGMNIEGKFKTLESMNDKDWETLAQAQQSQGDNIAEIAVDVRSIADKFTNTGKQVSNVQGNLENVVVADIVDWLVSEVYSSKFATKAFGGMSFGENIFDKAFSADNSMLNNAAGLIFSNNDESRTGSKSIGIPSDLSDLGDMGRVKLPEFMYNSSGLYPKAPTYANGGDIHGPSHAEGGVPVIGSNIVVEGGEYVVNKHAMSNPMYSSIIRNINESTNDGPAIMANGGEIQYGPGGYLGGVMSQTSHVYNSVNNFGNNILPDYSRMGMNASNVNQSGNISSQLQEISNSLRSDLSKLGSYNDNTPRKIDLNISGTIKLEAPDGSKIDFKELLKNPIFARELTRVVSDTLDSKKGIYNKNSLSYD